MADVPRRAAERIPPTDRDRARFAKYVDRNGPTPEHRPELGPCWRWTGSIKTKRGYGQFQWGGWGKPNRSAHAFAWEEANGPIPNDLTVDHLCRMTGCVRLSHLELVTQEENFRRGVEHRRRMRTSCPNGHGLEHTLQESNGRMCCQRCKRECSRRRRQRTARLANGLPDRRYRLDPEAVRRALAAVDAGVSMRQAALAEGFSDRYLNRLVKRRATDAGMGLPGGRADRDAEVSRVM